MSDITVIIGSSSDEELLKECLKAIDEFGIKREVFLASAHRSPNHLEQIIRDAEKNGTKVFIAIAGKAAHLPGVVASKTVLPVIGVPAYSEELSGLDALLSIVQMPKHVPVGAVGIGKTGAYNAGLLAVSILAVSDERLREMLLKRRKRLEEELKKENESLSKRYNKGG
jgi:5-(carboxyamino)imidazole ribonucleotide mutase